METWPEFVRDSDAAVPRAGNELTGWETVVFELEDDPDQNSGFSAL